MTFEGVIGLILLVVAVAGNVVATLLAVRDEFTERHQKIVQVALVWLLPVFGTIFVLALHRKPEEPAGTYRNTDEPIGADASSPQAGRSIQTHADD